MDLKKLIRNGWLEITAVELSVLDHKLLDIAGALGRPVKQRASVGLVQKLVPTDGGTAKSNSLSAKYSLGSFPLHVDTSHWTTPCRYLVFGCFNSGEENRDTLLLDFKNINISESDKKLLQTEPYRIANGRRSFYGKVLSKNRSFIRYDLGCMTSLGRHGEDVKYLFSEDRNKHNIKRICWKEGKILIVDNFRVLHGRSCSLNNNTEREESIPKLVEN